MGIDTAAVGTGVGAALVDVDAAVGTVEAGVTLAAERVALGDAGAVVARVASAVVDLVAPISYSVRKRLIIVSLKWTDSQVLYLSSQQDKYKCTGSGTGVSRYHRCGTDCSCMRWTRPPLHRSWPCIRLDTGTERSALG